MAATKHQNHQPTSTSPRSMSRKVSSVARTLLEKHDEGIAAITGSTSNRTLVSNSTDTSVLTSDLVVDDLASSHRSTPTVSSIRRQDLRQINLIGTGQFCKVHLASVSSTLLSLKDASSSSSLFDHHRRGYPTLVAVKSIDFSRVTDPQQLAVAAGELANEAKMLSTLDHENIIRLKGICSESFSASFDDHQSGGYFLVLEILRETLFDRLQKWRRQKQKKEREDARNQRHSRYQRLFRRRVLPAPQSSRARGRNSHAERLARDEERQSMHGRVKETVLGIVHGMDYLHSRGIVLRDLKPGNIGYEENSGVVEYGSAVFDQKGDAGDAHGTNSVRLFDFGMAQKVSLCDPMEVCGSLRYMAPEVLAGKGYSLKVDVYSFGVVLFETCSLLHPFEEAPKPKRFFRKRKNHRKHPMNQSMDDFRERLLAREIVPAKNPRESVCCPDLGALIEECLSFDPEDRPGFPEIRARLTSIFGEDP